MTDLDNYGYESLLRDNERKRGLDRDLVDIPSNDVSLEVTPETRVSSVATVAPTDEAISNHGGSNASNAVNLHQGIRTAFHTGPTYVSFHHERKPYDSLLEKFAASVTYEEEDDAPSAVAPLPQAPPMSLLQHRPGSEALEGEDQDHARFTAEKRAEAAARSRREAAEVAAEEGKSGPRVGAADFFADEVPEEVKVKPVVVAAAKPVDDSVDSGIVSTAAGFKQPKFGTDRFVVADTNSEARLPLLGSQRCAGMSTFSAVPTEQEVCNRAITVSTSPHGESDRARYPFVDRPNSTRFILRLDRLVAAGVENATGTSGVAHEVAHERSIQAPDASFDITETQNIVDPTGLPLEPLWASVALYSLAEKRRISETFGWVAGSKTAQHSAGALGADSERCSSVMFTVPNAGKDIYVVVRLYRILGGSANADSAADLYSQCARQRAKKLRDEPVSQIAAGQRLSKGTRREAQRLRDKASAAAARLGPLLESFAICALPVFGAVRGEDRRSTFNIFELFGSNKPGHGTLAGGARALPAFAPPFMSAEEEAEAVKLGGGSDGSLAGGEKFIGQPQKTLGGTAGGYSPEWRRYRIRRAVEEETLLELGPFYRFKSGQYGVNTLDDLLTEHSEDAQPVGTEVHHDIKPKYVFLGDDGNVLRFIMNTLRNVNLPKKMDGVALRAHSRLLTWVGAAGLPDVLGNPIVLPRNLDAVDWAGRFSPEYSPPLSWLLGIDVSHDTETVMDSAPLPGRAPLFTAQDLEAIGMAGYTETENMCRIVPEIASLVNAVTSRDPPALKKREELTEIHAPAAETAVLKYGKSPGFTKHGRAVLDGNRPLLLSPDGSQTVCAVARHANQLSDYWLVPSPAGTFSSAPTADTQSHTERIESVGSRRQVSTGKELGAVHDLIHISPLSLSVSKGVKFPCPKTRARNIAVSVQVMIDDSAGAGAWRPAYTHKTDAYRADEAIAAAVLANSSSLAMPAEDPRTGRRESVQCIFPPFVDTVKVREAQKINTSGCTGAGQVHLSDPLVNVGLSSVAYHDKEPVWSDTFKAALPSIASNNPIAGDTPKKAHLLFTFYHVVVRDSTKGEADSGAYVPIGYGFYPLLDPHCPTRINAARNVRIPLAHYLPPGYLSICGLMNKASSDGYCIPNITSAHIPWWAVERSRVAVGTEEVRYVRTQPSFTFNLDLSSSVRTSSKDVAELYNFCDEVSSLPPSDLSLANKSKAAMRRSIGVRVPTFQGLVSANDLMENMHSMLTALLNTLTYASACSSLPDLEGALDASPQTPPQSPGRGVSLHSRVFKAFVKLAEQISQVSLFDDGLVAEEEDTTATDAHFRHPLLEYWVSTCFTSQYFGRNIYDLLPPAIRSALPGEQQSFIDLHGSSPTSTAHAVHPTADALMRTCTEVMGGDIGAFSSLSTPAPPAKVVDADVGKSLASIHKSIGALSWFVFDLIVKDIRFAAFRHGCKGEKPSFDCGKPRTGVFSARFYRDLSSFVRTIAIWSSSKLSVDNTLKARVNGNLVLMLRDLCDVCDRGEIFRILDQDWNKVMSDVGTPPAWKLRLAGWRLIADHPRFPALMFARRYGSEKSDSRLDLRKWGAHMAKEHILGHLFVSAIEEGLVQTAITVRSQACDLLTWFLSRLDCDGSLETTSKSTRLNGKPGVAVNEEKRQAIVCMLFSIVQFCVKNARDLIGVVIDIVPSAVSPASAEGTYSSSNTCEDANAADFQIRLGASLLWIIRHTPSQMLSDWFRAESETTRRIVFAVMYRLLSIFDYRALARAARAVSGDDGSIKAAEKKMSTIATFYTGMERRNASRRVQRPPVEQTGFTTYGRRFGSVSAAVMTEDGPATLSSVDGTEMKRELGAGTGTRSRYRGHDVVVEKPLEYEVETVDEFDPLFVAGITQSTYESIRTRECLAAHLSCAACATVTDALNILVETHNTARTPSAAPLTIPGAHHEVALQFSLLIKLLSVPLAARPAAIGLIAKHAVALIRRTPSVMACAPLWSALVLAVIRLLDSPLAFVRKTACSLLYVMIKQNWDGVPQLETIMKRVGSGSTMTLQQAELLEQLNSLHGVSTVAQSRVAALVAVSYLTSEAEVLLTHRRSRGTAFKHDVANRHREGASGKFPTTGVDVSLWDFKVAFGGTEAASERLDRALKLLTEYSASQTKDQAFATHVRSLSASIGGIVHDSRALLFLKRSARQRDVADLCDVYIRQACLYLNVPTIALRWFEALTTLLLSCGNSTTANVETPADTDRGRFVEAGMAAVCAAALVGCRMNVPYNRYVDSLSILDGLPTSVIRSAGFGSVFQTQDDKHVRTSKADNGIAYVAHDGSTVMVRLGRLLVPHLAEVCPAVLALVGTGALGVETSEFSRRFMLATSLFDDSSTELSLDAADLVVADAYSASSSANVQRLLRLLLIASNCFGLEGPHTEFAQITYNAFTSLATRLACSGGTLGGSDSRLIIPHEECVKTDPLLRKLSLMNFATAEDPERKKVLASKPDAGWWPAVEAGNRAIGVVTHLASEREIDRCLGRFYRVTIHGKRFFELSAAAEGSSTKASAASHDLDGKTFIYRLPAEVRVKEFGEALERVWQTRASALVGELRMRCPLGQKVAVSQFTLDRTKESAACMSTDDAAAMAPVIAMQEAALKEARDALAAAEAAGQKEILTVDDGIKLLRSSKLVSLLNSPNVKQSDLDEVASFPKILLQITTVKPLRPAQWFGARGSDDWDSCREILGEEAKASLVDETFLRVTAEDPDLGLADSERTTGFDSQVFVSRFFFEVQVNMINNRVGDMSAGAAFTGMRRTVLEVSLDLPSPLPRLRTTNVREITLSPVRGAINTMKAQSDAIEVEARRVAAGDFVPLALRLPLSRSEDPDEVTAYTLETASDGFPKLDATFVEFGVGATSAVQPRGVNSLQLRLQGSVMTLINSGPCAAVRPFLVPSSIEHLPEGYENVDKPSEDDIIETKLVMARFARVCRYALDVDAFFAPEKQQPFHVQLESGWLKMCRELEDMEVPVPQ